MKDLFIPEHKLMDFEFYDLRNVPMHYHQNPELLYVLEGSLKIVLEEKDCLLQSRDFYIINANTRHALLSDAPVFYVCLHLNFIRLQHYLDMNRVIFLCDSNGMNDTLRQSISSLLDQIITNYKSDIRLADLAEQLYLSPAYLSKYIKTRLHMNFVDYVNSIRLYHAVAEIRNSEKKITNIAIDNGFSNLTAFSHAFKKFYDMTPSEFRAREKEKKQAGQAGALDAKIAKKAEDYLKNRSASAPEQALSRQYLIADAHNQKIYSKYWKRMIIDNLGGISLLGYWLGSDLFSRHNYTNDILNGKSRQPPAALRQRLWPLAGGRHLVIPPGPGALADPLDDLLAVQSQAQRPGHLRGADTSGIMVKSVGTQYRNRFKGTGAVHLHVTAEFGRAGHRK